jgi:hypothetical protein
MWGIVWGIKNKGIAKIGYPFEIVGVSDGI